MPALDHLDPGEVHEFQKKQLICKMNNAYSNVEGGYLLEGSILT